MTELLRLLAHLQVVSPALLDRTWLKESIRRVQAQLRSEAPADASGLAASLSELSKALSEGRNPNAAGDAFTLEQQDRLRGEAAFASLAQAFDTFAELLPYWEWHTQSVREIEVAIGSGQTALPVLERRLEEAWAHYDATTVAEEEVTAETLVSHRALCSGLQKWNDCLDFLAVSDWPSALSAAEVASRKLVALQRYQERHAHLHGAEHIDERDLEG